MQTNKEVTMQYNLIISRLTSLNEYSNAERTNRYNAARIKRQNTELVAYTALSQLQGVKITKPVYIEYLWVEPNTLHDKSNVAFAKKYVEDGLVMAGILKNDKWNDIIGFKDEFAVDKHNPRVEVTIIESEG
jgi:hypothetical protein